ncbi:HAD family hydrolase [Roseibium sp.]|uniref:HAD family hydrolase n=1 Tax=Roseibium sp. TaxID=1936156 RepID=UPI003A98665C
MATAITHVVFDVGNVLIEWDPIHLYQSLIPDAAEREDFLTRICSMEWNLQQDLGRGWAEAVAELSAEHPEKAELIAAYSNRWHDMVPGAIDGTVEILEELKQADVPLYAITNFSSEKWQEATTRFDFLKTSFIDTVVSAEERIIKPDARIYEALLGRNALNAAACVFIDDSPKNVEGAKAVGLEALHFTSPEKLRRDLLDLGLPLVKRTA